MPSRSSWPGAAWCGRSRRPPRWPEDGMASYIGQPIDRADARAKVTGVARYASEHRVPNAAHAVLVTSTVAKGRIAELDTRAAEQIDGVLAVMTHENAPRLSKAGATTASGSPSRAVTVFQDNAVRYANQPIGVVIAETLEAAREGAARVVVHY